ncbi:MAG: hypothetical protein ACPHKJ_03585, partial [Litorivicinaceae bacterium]
MEITWVLAVIATVGAILAAYFAKLWLKAKAELAELLVSLAQMSEQHHQPLHGGLLHSSCFHVEIYVA